MKINPINTKIFKNNQTFKGFDAAPLKSIYMEGIDDYDTTKDYWDMQDVATYEEVEDIWERQRQDCLKITKEIFKDLKSVAEKEKINLYYLNTPNDTYDKYKGSNTEAIQDSDKIDSFGRVWAQDVRHFAQKDGKPVIMGINDEMSYMENTIAKNENIEHERLSRYSRFPAGGNIYIGKDNKGEKWMLVGSFNYYNTSPINKYSEMFEIKSENIHEIDTKYHIDLMIRPIGYPYVLVNDKRLVLENLKKAGEDITDEKYKKYIDTEDELADGAVEKLTQLGFKPIRVGGVYSDAINYINALVNKHEDGTISYITNSTRYSEDEKFDKIFEEELKSKISNLDQIYFVSGGKVNSDLYMSNVSKDMNGMMNRLQYGGGGIHCSTTEMPDFEKWV